MGRALILALAAVSTAAAASAARADVALVLTDQERAALISAIAAGLQAQPQFSGQAVYLLNKINTAPVVQSQTPVPDKPAATDPPKDKTP